MDALKLEGEEFGFRLDALLVMELKPIGLLESGYNDCFNEKFGLFILDGSFRTDISSFFVEGEFY